MSKKLIGIDLGGTTTKFGIIRIDGTIEHKWSIQTDISDEGENIVPNIIDSIQNVLNQRDVKVSDLLGIGMGSPGTVNRANGTVTGAYNLNWKSLQPVRKPIEEALGIDFFFDNDANVAALGEQWQGAGNQEPNIIFVTLGTGVGGGIILNNQLIHGVADGAGEIGHITVDEDGYPCTCGKQGCLETVASATGIVRMAHDQASGFKGNSILIQKLRNCSDKDIDAKAIFDYAKENDAFAIDIVNRYCYYLGSALANVSSLLNPSTIVLGGGVSHAGEFLSKKVAHFLDQYIFPTMKGMTQIKIAKLGNDAGIIGAASLVLSER